MMKDVKYKFWDKFNERWLDSALIAITGLGEIYSTVDNDYLSNSEIIPLQYTGLSDRNGVEIYEGDVVEFVGSNGCAPSSHPYGGECRDWLGQKIVIVYNSSFFHGRHVEGYEPNKEYPHNCILSGWEILKPYDLWNYAGWTKVIGNIYENPKLLKSK